MSSTAPRRRDRRHERHDRTRSEILDQAWAIARRDGVATLSLREVARAVGVQPQSLYTYVTSKNDLLDALFAQATAELVALLRDVPDESPEARLRRGARVFVEHCAAHPERFLLVFQRPVPGFEPSPASMALAFELFGELAAALHAVGVTDAGAVDLFTAAITGLISQQVSNEPGGDRWTRLLDRLVTALLAA